MTYCWLAGNCVKRYNCKRYLSDDVLNKLVGENGIWWAEFPCFEPDKIININKDKGGNK